jgi:PilZ domain
LQVERRRFKRYVVHENGFEVFSRQLKIQGKLKDISEGGLAYQYTPFNGEATLSEVIDVLSLGPERLYMQGLVCKRIYDIVVLSEDRGFRGIKTRLRGLEFDGLSEKQRQKVVGLIGGYETA